MWKFHYTVINIRNFVNLLEPKKISSEEIEIHNAVKTTSWNEKQTEFERRSIGGRQTFSSFFLIKSLKFWQFSLCEEGKKITNASSWNTFFILSSVRLLLSLHLKYYFTVFFYVNDSHILMWTFSINICVVFIRFINFVFIFIRTSNRSLFSRLCSWKLCYCHWLAWIAHRSAIIEEVYTLPSPTEPCLSGCWCLFARLRTRKILKTDHGARNCSCFLVSSVNWKNMLECRVFHANGVLAWKQASWNENRFLWPKHVIWPKTGDFTQKTGDFCQKNRRFRPGVHEIIE